MPQNELFEYHPELVVLLAANVVLPLLALLFRRRALQIVAAVCLIVSVLDVVGAVRFERGWNAQMGEMYQQFQAGNRAASLHIAQQLLEVARTTFPTSSTRVIEGVHHVGWLLVHNNRPAEAEPYFRESLAGYERLDATLPNDHELVCSHGVGNERSLLGYVFEQTNRAELADQFYRNALEHYRTRCPGFPQYQTEMADALQHLHGSGH